MAAHKGHAKAGGRKAGTPNKATATARGAFQMAFDAIGGASALATWASENPTEFYKLYGRLIPVDVNAKGDLNTTLTILTGVPRADS